MNAQVECIRDYFEEELNCFGFNEENMDEKNFFEFAKRIIGKLLICGIRSVENKHIITYTYKNWEEESQIDHVLLKRIEDYGLK